MSLLGITEVVAAVGQVAGDLITTDKEKRQLDLEDKKLDQVIDLAQLDVNKVEAGNGSVFVSGARPFIIWVCGFALLYAAILEPMARFAATVLLHYVGPFPLIDTTITLQVLFALLGLGGYRSVEKIKGVASK